MANFDDLKLAVEAASGGVNTVLFDDQGMPSIMVVIPKMLRSDLVEGATDDAHYAFLVDGVEKDKVYIGKYLSIVQNSRAYSLPMQDPRASVTFTNALTYCRNKGEGWGLVPASLWSAIALWCKKNGFQPHGNNNYGADYSYPWEKGIPTTYGTDDDEGKVYHTATGSGPATWYHDGTRNGIADLNGNVREWCGGMRINAGEIQIIPYANCMPGNCDQGASSDAWKCIDKDGNIVDQGSDNTLKLDWVNSRWRWITGDPTDIDDSTRNCTFANVQCDDDISDSAKILLRGLTLLPEDGDTDYESDRFYANNYGTDRPLHRGGVYSSTTNAGVFYSTLYHTRSSSNVYLGFRSAFYD